MELLALRLLLTEEDINTLVTQHLGADQSVRELRVRLTPEGVHVTGAYALAFFNVRFDTRWVLSVWGREVAATLADLRVAGAPAGLVRNTLLDMLAANLENEAGLRVADDSILLDPDVLLRRFGLTARTNLTAVRCEAGQIVVEGGTVGERGASAPR